MNSILLRLSLILIVLTACKKNSDAAGGLSTVSSAPNDQSVNGNFSVSWYTIGEMPVECPAPPGLKVEMGVAVVEGDPLISGLTCGGKKNSAGYPDCSNFIADAKICGRIFNIKNSESGKIVKAYFSGICPWDHPDNVPKGKWNPCGRNRRHLDMMESVFTNLGFTSAHSWGENGKTGTVNPQAKYVSATVDDSFKGMKTCEQLRKTKTPCDPKVFK